MLTWTINFGDSGHDGVGPWFSATRRSLMCIAQGGVSQVLDSSSVSTEPTLLCFESSTCLGGKSCLWALGPSDASDPSQFLSWLLQDQGEEEHGICKRVGKATGRGIGGGLGWENDCALYWDGKPPVFPSSSTSNLSVRPDDSNLKTFPKSAPSLLFHCDYHRSSIKYLSWTMRAPNC